jgi:hypothetical protein
MGIQREGRFLVTHDLGTCSWLGIESDRMEKCLAEVRAKQYRGVFGTPDFGFREENLDFLREVPWVREVWFWDIDLKDVEGLYALHDLRSFGVHEKRPPVDFSRFPELEKAVWFFSPRDRGMESRPRLETLHLWRFHPKSKSFEGLQLSPALKTLEITFANPPNLDGFPTLPNLRRLKLARCRNLVTLAGLPGLAPWLEELIITTSSRVTNVSALKGMPGLKLAVLNGNRLV